MGSDLNHVENLEKIDAIVDLVVVYKDIDLDDLRLLLIGFLR